MSSPRLVRASASSRVLPMPALPSTTTNDPSPARARSASARIAASSPSRSRNGRSRACTGVDEMPSRSSNSSSGRSSPGSARLPSVSSRRPSPRSCWTSAAVVAGQQHLALRRDQTHARGVLARGSRIAARLARVQGDAHAAAAGRAVDEVDRRRDRGVRAREDAEHGAAAAFDLEAAVLAERRDHRLLVPGLVRRRRRAADETAAQERHRPRRKLSARCHLTRARG